MLLCRYRECIQPYSKPVESGGVLAQNVAHELQVVRPHCSAGIAFSVALLYTCLRSPNKVRRRLVMIIQVVTASSAVHLQALQQHSVRGRGFCISIAALAVWLTSCVTVMTAHGSCFTSYIASAAPAGAPVYHKAMSVVEVQPHQLCHSDTDHLRPIKVTTVAVKLKEVKTAW
jgi:hypothetical protein